MLTAVSAPRSWWRLAPGSCADWVRLEVQVQLERAVGPHVRPEQWTVRPAIFCGEGDGLVGEDALQQEGVDVDQRRLQQVQGEDADFLAVTVGAGEFAVLAIEQRAVGRIPVLHDLQP